MPSQSIRRCAVSFGQQKPTARAPGILRGEFEVEMARNFAEVVEEVKQLSVAEKEVLQKLLRKYLIEERRREIRENAELQIGAV